MMKTILSTLVGISAFFTSLMPNVLGLSDTSSWPYYFTPGSPSCTDMTQCQQLCQNEILATYDNYSSVDQIPQELKDRAKDCVEDFGFTYPTLNSSSGGGSSETSINWSVEFNSRCTSESSCHEFCICSSAGSGLGYKCDQYFAGWTSQTCLQTTQTTACTGYVCPSGGYCVACLNQCKNLNVDAQNCGSCGNVCDSNKYCSNGACVATTLQVFTFPTSGYTCSTANDYIECKNYCTNVVKPNQSHVDRSKCIEKWPSLMTTSSSSTTNSDTTTTPYVTAVRIKPDTLYLKPNETKYFTAEAVRSDGSVFTLSNTQVSWVRMSGGEIFGDGRFTAVSTTGRYENAVKVVYVNFSDFASVEIAVSTSGGSSVVSSPATIMPTLSPYTTSSSTGTSFDINDDTDTQIADMFLAEPERTDTLPAVAPLVQSEKPKEMFGFVNAQVDSCLKSNFSADFYNKFFSPNGEHADLSLISVSDRDKARKCMEAKKLPELDNKVAACLELRLGLNRFTQVYKEGQKLTNDEQKVIGGCFSVPNLVNVDRNKEIDKTTKSCLEIQLGSDRFKELIEGGQKPSTEDLAKGRECMNFSSSVVNAPVVMQTDVKDVNCLEVAVGKVRFKEINENHKKPTKAEQLAGAKCFGQEKDGVVSAQDVFLPPVPEQVPYIQEVSEKEMAIDYVSKDEEVAEGDSLTLSGVALPNTNVDIYIFSDPIVISTTTDENGNWSYELSYHLPEGEHNAYTVIRHPEQGLVRSGLFSFGVAYARGEANTPEVLVATPVDPNRISLYLVMSGMMIFSGVGVLLFVFRDKLIKNKGNRAMVEAKVDDALEVNLSSVDRGSQVPRL